MHRYTDLGTQKHTEENWYTKDIQTHTSILPCPCEHRTPTFAYSCMHMRKWTCAFPHLHIQAPLHIPSTPCTHNLYGPSAKCHEQSATPFSPNPTHGEQAETRNLMELANIPSCFWGAKVGV